MSSGRHAAEHSEQARDVRLVVDTIPPLARTSRPVGSAEFFNQRWLDYTGNTLEELNDWATPYIPMISPSCVPCVAVGY